MACAGVRQPSAKYVGSSVLESWEAWGRGAFPGGRNARGAWGAQKVARYGACRCLHGGFQGCDLAGSLFQQAERRKTRLDVFVNGDVAANAEDVEKGAGGAHVHVDAAVGQTLAGDDVAGVDANAVRGHAHPVCHGGADASPPFRYGIFAGLEPGPLQGFHQIDGAPRVFLLLRELGAKG